MSSRPGRNNSKSTSFPSNTDTCSESILNYDQRKINKYRDKREINTYIDEFTFNEETKTYQLKDPQRIRNINPLYLLNEIQYPPFFHLNQRQNIQLDLSHMNKPNLLVDKSLFLIDCGYTIKWKGNAKEKYSFVLKTKNYQSKEILQEKTPSQNVLSKVPKLFKMMSYQHIKNGFRILRKKGFSGVIDRIVHGSSNWAEYDEWFNATKVTEEELERQRIIPIMFFHVFFYRIICTSITNTQLPI